MSLNAFNILNTQILTMTMRLVNVKRLSHNSNSLKK